MRTGPPRAVTGAKSAAGRSMLSENARVSGRGWNEGAWKTCDGAVHSACPPQARIQAFSRPSGRYIGPLCARSATSGQLMTATRSP